MHFKPLALAGAWLIEPTPHGDERGAFARTFCTQEFAAHGLETAFAQHSQSTSHRRGTLRGVHFQLAPHEEVKVVRCTAGAIYDVIVDLRPASPTYKRWQGLELTAESGHQVYVPKGFAHGHMTLSDAAAVHYLISVPYAPGASAGVRYDDPALAIIWPLAPTVISERDRTWPLLT
jgi:dTDP-4-dehydrorhamnose 3,5-epimerase